MQLNELSNMTSHFRATDPMPVLFLGHGSPMNAIQENEYFKMFAEIGKKIPKPQAILCISAHWETHGTFVTAMEKPPTIHDFGGFPKALFEVQYPVNGSPELATETQKLLENETVGLDYKWGLDHGAWSVLMPMFPDADVPVIQMSLDFSRDAQRHFDLAKQLMALRRKGVLVVGSGNMIHNLRMVAWHRINDSYGYDWALEAQDKMRHYITNHDFEKLILYQKQGTAFNLAIPTPEHYLPLLYVLALKEERDEVSIFNDKPVAGSLTMTSVMINSQ